MTGHIVITSSALEGSGALFGNRAAWTPKGNVMSEILNSGGQPAAASSDGAHAEAYAHVVDR
jgi:hypothetical protein